MIENADETCFTKLIAPGYDFIRINRTTGGYAYKQLKIFDGELGSSTEFPYHDIYFTYILTTGNIATIQYQSAHSKHMNVTAIGVYHTPCRFEYHGYDGDISSTQIPEQVNDWAMKYQISQKCSWIFNVSTFGYRYSKYKFVNRFGLYRYAMFIIDGVRNGFCEISLGNGIQCPKPGLFHEGRIDWNGGHIIKITYVFQPGVSPNFSYFLTMYDELMHMDCDNSAFHCSNGRCIDRSLVCNGRNNCGNKQDEDINICNSYQNSNTTHYHSHVVLYISIFILIVAIILLSHTMYTIKKKKSSKSVHYDNECILIE